MIFMTARSLFLAFVWVTRVTFATFGQAFEEQLLFLMVGDCQVVIFPFSSRTFFGQVTETLFAKTPFNQPRDLTSHGENDQR